MSIYLPNIPYLLDNIIEGNVTSFVKPLPRSAVAKAAKEGYTELVPCTRRRLFGNLNFAVEARRPGTTDGDDYRTILSYTGVEYLQPLLTDRQTVLSAMDRIEHWAKKAGFQRVTGHSRKTIEDYDKLIEGKTRVINANITPFMIQLLHMKLARVRDTDPGQMRAEGLRTGRTDPGLHDDEPEYFREHYAPDGTYHSFGDLFDFEHEPFLKRPTPEAAYENFIRTAYGPKVWDDNEYVLRITFAPWLRSPRRWDVSEPLDNLLLTELLGGEAVNALREKGEQTGKNVLRLIREAACREAGLPDPYGKQEQEDND